MIVFGTNFLICHEKLKHKNIQHENFQIYGISLVDPLLQMGVAVVIVKQAHDKRGTVESLHAY